MINKEQPEVDLSSSAIKSDNSKGIVKAQKFNWGKSLKIKTKTTLIAIAIGVVPTIALSCIAYYYTAASVSKEISSAKETLVADLQNLINVFMSDRKSDIEVMANLDIFTDPKLRDIATAEDKSAALQKIQDAYDIYNSIAVFDAKGDFIAKTDGKSLGNHLNRGYIQAALKADRAIISEPRISTSTGIFSVYTAAPIHDKVTGETIGFVRARIPVEALKKLLEDYTTRDRKYYLLNESGDIFLGSQGEYVMQTLSNESTAENKSYDYEAINIRQVFSNIEQLLTTKNIDTAIATNIDTKTEQLIAFAPSENLEALPELNWQAAMAVDTSIVFAPQRQLRNIFIIGTVATALLVAVIAAYLANRATLPIIDAVAAVKKIGSGDLDTRLSITAQDEIGELNANINLMSEQIQSSFQEQTALAKQQRQQKEELEAAIYTLIEEISDATDGDLTVRANLDSMELSTVADLFNAIIDNLQEIAIEAKDATTQVGDSLSQNETAIRSLADRAIAEAQETRDTLLSVEQMSLSIQAVAQNANQAEQITNDTYNKIVQSTKDINLTVDSIGKLRNTVGDTAQKMEILDESSQKISKAVTLIEEISLKTQVLAINASAEAERAGEYGQGFAVVAEQVGSLAQQVKAATQEIAKIVTSIQLEAKEVTQAMRSGTDRVLDSTNSVESARASLVEVLKKSSEVNTLINLISQSTVSQADTSQNVTNLMQKIAQLSETTSKSSQEVAQSIVETAQVAAKLQSTVAQFKVTE